LGPREWEALCSTRVYRAHTTVQDTVGFSADRVPGLQVRQLRGITAWHALREGPLVAVLAAPYLPRRPTETVLYKLVRQNLESFLAYAREHYDGGLPRYVENELRAYLRCGLFSEGFSRAHCDACGHDLLVAFSCKSRTACPSCAGRRMANTAAAIVDLVLPDNVPVRLAAVATWTSDRSTSAPTSYRRRPPSTRAPPSPWGVGKWRPCRTVKHPRPGRITGRRRTSRPSLSTEPAVRWALGAVPGSHRVGFRAPPSEPGVLLSLSTGLSIDGIANFGGVC
jgi:hypothetical protein